jgi:hypothetical protein
MAGTPAVCKAGTAGSIDAQEAGNTAGAANI